MKLSMKEYSIISLLEKNGEMIFRDIKEIFKDSSASIRTALNSLISKNIIDVNNIGKNNYKYKLNHIYKNNRIERLIYSDTQKILKFLSTFQEFESDDMNDIVDKLDEVKTKDEVSEIVDKLKENDNSKEKIEEINSIIKNQQVIEDVNTEPIIEYNPIISEDYIVLSNNVLNLYINKSGKTVSNRDPIIEYILPFFNNEYKTKDMEEAINLYINDFSNGNQAWSSVSSPIHFFSKVLLTLL